MQQVPAAIQDHDNLVQIHSQKIHHIHDVFMQHRDVTCAIMPDLDNVQETIAVRRQQVCLDRVHKGAPEDKEGYQWHVIDDLLDCRTHKSTVREYHSHMGSRNSRYNSTLAR